MAHMTFDRRLFLLGAAASAAMMTPARAAPLATFGLDGSQFGVRPGAPDDQSVKLQRALDHCAQTRVPLMLAPGVYRCGDLRLAAGAQVFGVRGATRLAFTRGAALMSGEGAEAVTLSGLTFDGNAHKLPPNRGLVHLVAARGLRIADCTVNAAGGNAVAILNSDGSVTGNTIAGAADNALYCVDNSGLIISANIIRGAGNGLQFAQDLLRCDGIGEILIRDAGDFGNPPWDFFPLGKFHQARGDFRSSGIASLHYGPRDFQQVP